MHRRGSVRLLSSRYAWLVAGLVASTTMAVQASTFGRDWRMLFSEPLVYRGDALFHAGILKVLSEGDLPSAHRLGYPFASFWLDWPALDWGTLAVGRVLAVFSHDWVVIFNLLFMLGFPAAFASAFLVSRRLGLRNSLAFVVGLSYSLASYHFERLLLHGHLFLTWYWVAPVFVWLAWTVAQPSLPPERTHLTTRIARFLGIAALTSFGIYYTAFGLITLVIGLGYAAMRGSSRMALRRLAALAPALAFGVALQVTPFLLHAAKFGRNLTIGARNAGDSETWGLRPIQLFLPHRLHRIPVLQEKATAYERIVGIGNESIIASVGMLAGLGLCLLLLLLLLAAAGHAMDENLRFFSFLTAILMAFASLGGLGTLAAAVAIPGIRSWNRLSIFLAFIGLVAVAIAVGPSLDRLRPRFRRALTPMALVTALLFIWIDQTPSPALAFREGAMGEHGTAKRFLAEVEAKLPRGAAVYQLPFAGFPEAQRASCSTYELLIPLVESASLRFNLGVMRGRPGDRFYRTLAQQPLDRQVQVIRDLGFSGIYVYCVSPGSGAERTAAALTGILGESAATWRSDGEAVFFMLDRNAPTLGPEPLSLERAIALSGFVPAYPSRAS